MNRLIGLACLAMLAGCTDPAADAAIAAKLKSPPGQLFCLVQTHGGGDAVVGLLDAEASALAPGAGPVAVIATGLGKVKVDDLCNEAAKQAGGTGMPVSPPLDPATAALVAIVVSQVQSVKP
jgi:hypothetical protein